jgi:hypothetical protein
VTEMTMSELAALVPKDGTPVRVMGHDVWYVGTFSYGGEVSS